MKNPFLLLVVCSLLVFFTADIVLAEWQIQYDAEANRVLHLGGQTKRGSFATKEQCQAYWESQTYWERQHSRCVGYDTPIFTPPSPTPKTPTIDWPALEAKYFAEADQKGWTQIWIASGLEKRYYRKKNGNWVRISESERKKGRSKTYNTKGTWAKEEMVRKRLLSKRQIELEREKELFELGKSDLLKTLKGAGGEQGLALKPAPIVDLRDKKVDEIEESQFFYDLQMRKTGEKIASLPGIPQYYPRLNELTEIQNKAPVTTVIGSKFLEELKGKVVEKMKDKLKGIPGAKGLIEAYETVKKAAGGIYKPLVMDILEHDMELISQAARGDYSGLEDEIWFKKNKEKLEKNVWKFTIGEVENKF